MEWARIYVDVARDGQVLAAGLERYTQPGTSQAAQERHQVSPAGLVEYALVDLVHLLAEFAMDNGEGWENPQGWQLGLFGDLGPFDAEKF